MQRIACVEAVDETFAMSALQRHAILRDLRSPSAAARYSAECTSGASGDVFWDEQWRPDFEGTALKGARRCAPLARLLANPALPLPTWEPMGEDTGARKDDRAQDTGKAPVDAEERTAVPA